MDHHDIPCRISTVLAAAAALGFFASAATAQTASAPACANEGEASVAALSRSWILSGWERKAGDGPLNFREKLGMYYGLVIV